MAPPPTAPLHFEEEGWSAGRERVTGLDEAGYGPLAGPVVVAAVTLRPGQRFEGATDSKLLAPEPRAELACRIQAECLCFAVAAASAREIERLNVRGAAILAFRRALARLPSPPDLLLLDGLRAPGIMEHTPLVRGDRRSHAIACASILAKVTRDRLMQRLDPRYPEYGWASNKGYRTQKHLAALRLHGPTPHHRTTFQGVLQLEMELGDTAASALPGGPASSGARSAAAEA